MAPAIFGVLERRRLRSAGGEDSEAGRGRCTGKLTPKLTTMSLSCELMVMREAFRGTVLFFPVTLFQHSAAHFHSCVHAFRTGVMRAFHSPRRWRPSVEGNEPTRPRVSYRIQERRVGTGKLKERLSHSANRARGTVHGHRFSQLHVTAAFVVLVKTCYALPTGRLVTAPTNSLFRPKRAVPPVPIARSSVPPRNVFLSGLPRSAVIDHGVHDPTEA